MTISEKVAYLKGLADGLDLQEKPSKEGKLIAKIIDILEDVGFAVEDLEVEVGSPHRRGGIRGGGPVRCGDHGL